MDTQKKCANKDCQNGGKLNRLSVITDEDGKQYCSSLCYSEARPVVIKSNE